MYGLGNIWKSGIWGSKKNLNIEKIIFKGVQFNFWAMHITNQKLSFDIFTVGNVLNIFMEHDINILMIFGIKEKCVILTHTMYCWLLLQSCAAYDCFCITTVLPPLMPPVRSHWMCLLAFQYSLKYINILGSVIHVLIWHEHGTNRSDRCRASDVKHVRVCRRFQGVSNTHIHTETPNVWSSYSHTHTYRCMCLSLYPHMLRPRSTSRAERDEFAHMQPMQFQNN